MTATDQEKHQQAEMVEHRDTYDATTTSEEEETGVPPGYWTSFRFIGSWIAIVLLANNLFIGYAMPANVLGVINADLGPDPNIYLATLMNTLIKGVGLLLIGNLSDILGRRYFIVGGQAMGFVGACIAATAKDINTIIGANVFIGIAGATQVLYPLLSQEIVPNKYRGFSQAAITVCVFPTLGLGPAFARMMVQYTALGWRWIFWLNAITTGLSLILFLTCYFPPNFEQLSHETSKRKQLKHLDYVGVVLYGGGLICLLLALSWGGKQYPWSSPRVIALLVVGIVVLIAFALYEIYMPLSTPLLPMKLFKLRNFWLAVIIGSVGQMSFYALNVLWPTQITALYTTDNLTIGFMSCTTGAALAAGEAIAGPFCKGGMHLKKQMMASVVGLCIFCGLMSLGNEFRRDVAISMTVCVGLFVGWVELIAIVVAGLVIPPENIGTGQAFFASTRATSGTIATSIYLAIYTNRSAGLMTSGVTKAATGAGLPSDSLPALFQAITKGTAAAMQAVPGLTPAISAAVAAARKSAYSASFSTVYLSSLAFGGAALVCCFFVTNDIDNYFTNFVNKTVTATQTKVKRDREETEKV